MNKRTIKIARTEKNLTQQELATILGIDINTLVKLEKGDYSTLNFPLMIKISDVLEKTINELFFSNEYEHQ